MSPRPEETSDGPTTDVSKRDELVVKVDSKRSTSVPQPGTETERTTVPKVRVTKHTEALLIILPFHSTHTTVRIEGIYGS